MKVGIVSQQILQEQNLIPLSPVFFQLPVLGWRFLKLCCSEHSLFSPLPSQLGIVGGITCGIWYEIE